MKYKDNVLRNGILLSLPVSAALWFGGCWKDVGHGTEGTPALESLIDSSATPSFDQVNDNDYIPTNINKDESEMINYKTSDFSRDSERVLLARMIFGEARNCSDAEKRAVAYTAINRAHDGKRWNGESVRESILKAKQYSCFNNGDPNLKLLKDPMSYEPQTFLTCLQIASDVLEGKSADMNRGQTHYHTMSIRPSWSNSGSMKRITFGSDDRHQFYRED
jgi:spore germination cell wall hydrolase CwlJ-like protein